MLKTACFCGLALGMTLGISSAKDYALQFKTLTAQEVMAFPGGYGATGSLRPKKPDQLQKEPVSPSKNPIYGELVGGDRERPLAFRLDESQGADKGYDRLIIDLNANGDLTDDPAISRAIGPDTYEELAGERERILFGPFVVPQAQINSEWRPVYYAQIYRYKRQISLLRTLSSVYLGYLRLKPGWYLETQVEAGGAEHKVGIVDGNGSLQLGESPTPRFTTNSSGKTWYFMPGDSFLVDTDGSGRFESNPFNTEASPYGSILYLGTTPYQVSLAKDFQSLQVEPCSEPLGQLQIKPHGANVRTVNVGRETKSDRWELIQATVKDGTAQLPAGNYRFYNDVLGAKAPSKDQVTAGSFYRKLDQTFKIARGKTTEFECGAPLTIKVNATKRAARASILGATAAETDAKPAVEYFGEDATPSDSELSISASATGAAGETFSSFAFGDDLAATPRKPAFSIITDGKEVAKGNLEFG